MGVPIFERPAPRHVRIVGLFVGHDSIITKTPKGFDLSALPDNASAARLFDDPPCFRQEELCFEEGESPTELDNLRLFRVGDDTNFAELLQKQVAVVHQGFFVTHDNE